MNFWTPKKIKEINAQLKDFCQQMKDTHGIDMELGGVSFTGTDGAHRGNIAKLYNVKSSDMANGVKSAVVLRPIPDYNYSKDELSAYSRMIKSVAFEYEISQTGVSYEDMYGFNLGDEIDLTEVLLNSTNNSTYWVNNNMVFCIKHVVGSNLNTLLEVNRVCARLVGFNKKKATTPMIFEILIKDDNDNVVNNDRMYFQCSIKAFVGELTNGYLLQLKLKKLGL
jgi:hypothetical protein